MMARFTALSLYYMFSCFLNTFQREINFSLETFQTVTGTKAHYASLK